MPLYSKKTFYLLFILPVIYGVLASIYLYQTKAFFTTFTDSTYIYLINGTNIAGGNFAIGHYDNPGTTGHIFAGIIIFFTHLFIGKGLVNEDVLSNPELYLKICAIVCIVFVLISVFVSGKLILKNTGNIFIALLFQLIPVSTYLATHYMVRICPEYLMLVILPYYCAYMFVLCLKITSDPYFLDDHIKPILFLSFITAALIVGKITCVPFLIVPLFFIKKISKKIIYLFATLIFGMLLLFPVWPNLKGMMHWFMSLATHNGKYGGGTHGLIDANSYLNNLNTLFLQEFFFSIGYFLVLIFIVVGLVKQKWKDNFYKLALTFWITITAQIILAAKHYDYHYLIPAQLLIIPTILALCHVFVPARLRKVVIIFLLTISATTLLYKMSQCATDYMDGNKEYESSLAAKKYADIPKIITTSYEESCFIESALHFGGAYGGDHFQTSYLFLRKQYPNSYFYLISNKSICWFDVNMPSAQLFEKYDKLLLYFFRKDDETEKDMMKNIIAGNDSLIKSIELVEHNYDTGEKFYLLTIDKEKTKINYTEKINIVCDFEKKTADNSSFISSDGKFYFGGAEANSTEKYASATNSVKATPQKQYVAWAAFPVKRGDAIDISVKVNYDDISGGIALSASDGKIFYMQGDFVVEDDGKGWKKVNLKTKIPNDYSEKEIRFSLFYFGKKACYFDDLNITLFKK